MNYFPFHVGDYVASTAHLSWDEDMAYTRLIRVYYQTEKPIPKDKAYRLARATTPTQKAAVDSVLEEFFTLDAGAYRQSRCEEEIAKFTDKQSKAKRSADARWKHHETQCESDANAMRTHSEGNANHNQEPITNNQTPKKNTSAIAPPDGVDVSVWLDFVDLRKSKKARLTQTAMDGIQAESVKAGWTLENALRECCARGWIGFKADWVADKPSRESPTGETAYQRSMRERVAEFSPSIARQAPGVYPLKNMILEAENVTAIAGH